MKGSLYIWIILCTTIFISCRDYLLPRSENEYYNNILQQLKVNPDSALLLFNNIDEESLNDASFAQRCMIAGQITDKLYHAIIPTNHYERANEWFSTYGTPKEQSPPLTILYTRCYHLRKEDKRMLRTAYFAFTFPAAFATGLIDVP